MKRVYRFIIVISLVLIILFLMPQKYYLAQTLGYDSELREKYWDEDIHSSKNSDRIYFFTSPGKVNELSEELIEKYDGDNLIALVDTSKSIDDILSKYSLMLKVIDVIILVILVTSIIIVVKKNKVKYTKKFLGILVLLASLYFANKICYAQEKSESIIDMKETFDNNGYPNGIVYLNPVYEDDNSRKIERYDVFVNTTSMNEIIDFLDTISINECRDVYIRHFNGTKEELLSPKVESPKSSEGIFDVIYVQSSIWYWLWIGFKHFLFALFIFIVIITYIFIDNIRNKYSYTNYKDF